MKVLKENSLLLLALVFVQCIFRHAFAIPVLVILCMYWHVRVKEKTWAAFLILAVIILPRSYGICAGIKAAQIIEVKENYCIAQSGLDRFVIYTDTVMPFDAKIEVKGTLREITSQKSFYGFDPDTWCRQINAYMYAEEEDIRILSEPVFSVRRFMQKRIDTYDEETAVFLRKTLLHIGKDAEEDLFLSTFSAASAILMLDSLLKLFVYKRTREKTVTGFCFLLCIIYRFEFICTGILLTRLYRMIYPEEKNICPVLILILLLFPDHALSAAFLIPAAYRLSRFTLHPKITSFTAVMMIQSYLFHSVSLFRTLLYPLLLRIRGIAWILSVVRLVSGIPADRLVRYVMDIKASPFLSFPSSPIGLGLPFFILLVFSLREKRYFHIYVPLLFFVFQALGLFHPFAEVTFINVSQGDSILVRAPLNTCNILIDTGKPSQYGALQSFLEGKGVSHIDTLIITHPDSDHNGNEDEVIHDYHADVLLKEYHDPIKRGPYVLYDLNEIKDEDENRSSLAEYFRINGLSFLCMGDADSITEEMMILKYNDLTCDILKLSHHGSSTGSCERFLDQVRPALGIVSSGPYSLYRHPSEETVQRLLKRHIPYFDTKEEGDITILCLPFISVTITSSHRIIFL